MKQRVSIFLLAGVMLCGTAPVQANVVDRGFGGAMGGAMLGSMLGGRKGAKKGAALGAAVGVIRGVDENARREERRKAMARQQAERQQILEAQRRQAQQAYPPPPPSSPGGAAGAAPGADYTTIVEIQKSLFRLGFDPGGVNGHMTPNTEQAISQYQAAKGLLETGQPSQALLTHMLRNGG